jgi:hypothetical protein
MKLYAIVLAFLFTLFFLPASWATSILPIGLEQLSTRATLIFYGEVISNQVKQDNKSGHIATLTTFKIMDLIKGNTGEMHTIKQIGGRLAETGTTLRVHGVPKFETGKEYVVFLPEKSRLGFSSPLGLHQGSFSVLTKNDQQVVTNGSNLTLQDTQNSRNIQLPLAVTTDKPSYALLDDFINTVRAYNLP